MDYRIFIAAAIGAIIGIALTLFFVKSKQKNYEVKDLGDSIQTIKSTTYQYNNGISGSDYTSKFSGTGGGDGTRGSSGTTGTRSYPRDTYSGGTAGTHPLSYPQPNGLPGRSGSSGTSGTSGTGGWSTSGSRYVKNYF